MGLLDDAIRQHLELKRRHGADPGDVAKLEHEAFGPVEREDALAMPVSDAPTAYVDDGEDAIVAGEEEAAYEESELEADETWARAHPEPGSAEAVTPEPPTAVEPPLADEPPVPRGGSVRLEDAEDLPPASRPRDAGPDPQPDSEPAEHDELEETPEFLQETPEHDRLWFEQKPPRDFDF